MNLKTDVLKVFYKKSHLSGAVWIILAHSISERQSTDLPWRPCCLTSTNYSKSTKQSRTLLEDEGKLEGGNQNRDLRDEQTLAWPGRTAWAKAPQYKGRRAGDIKPCALSTRSKGEKGGRLGEGRSKAQNTRSPAAWLSMQAFSKRHGNNTVTFSCSVNTQ